MGVFSTCHMNVHWDGFVHPSFQCFIPRLIEAYILCSANLCARLWTFQKFYISTWYVSGLIWNCIAFYSDLCYFTDQPVSYPFIMYSTAKAIKHKSMENVRHFLFFILSLCRRKSALVSILQVSQWTKMTLEAEFVCVCGHWACV